MKYIFSIFFLSNILTKDVFFEYLYEVNVFIRKHFIFLIHYCYEYPKVLTKWIFHARNNVTNIIINVCKVETEFEWTCHIVKTHFLLTDVSLLFPYCLQKLFVVTFSVEHTHYVKSTFLWKNVFHFICADIVHMLSHSNNRYMCR